MVNSGQQRFLTNALDAACDWEAKSMGFTIVIAISDGTAALAKKSHNKGNSKRAVGLAAASTRADAKANTPMKFISSREA